MLEAMNGVPAYIRNGRLDLLAGNALARALFAPIFASPARPVNSARFTFLDPAAAEFYPDWDAVADQNVATLRAEVGRNPYDKALSDLIGELSTRGDTFRQRWARHEVRRHRAGAKRLNHPLVGQMTFTYETMELTADEGLYLIVCGAAPGSRDADALNLLASWNATDNAETRAQADLSSRSAIGQHVAWPGVCWCDRQTPRLLLPRPRRRGTAAAAWPAGPLAGPPCRPMPSGAGTDQPAAPRRPRRRQARRSPRRVPSGPRPWSGRRRRPHRRPPPGPSGGWP